MRASLPEIGRTLGSWPQLASDVAMGAGAVVDTARRLLLGEPVASGRIPPRPGHPRHGGDPPARVIIRSNARGVTIGIP